MKEKQKQLIIDIMNDDAKDGLYKKQTAVGFLENAIHKYIAYVEGSHKAEPFTITQLSEAVEQAKEMEKQQIINANEDASTNELGEFLTGEQYYNQEYGNETTEKLE